MTILLLLDAASVFPRVSRPAGPQSGGLIVSSSTFRTRWRKTIVSHMIDYEN
jgi:hypothetical protein